MTTEAKVDSNGNFKFSPMFRWIVGGLCGIVLTGGGYSYVDVRQSIEVNARESQERDDKILSMAHENSLKIAELKSMQADLAEIKQLLRRAAPYELRKHDN